MDFISRRSLTSLSFLFTYGTLSPESPECDAEGGRVPDEVRGRLYHLGPYPALVDVDDPSAGWIIGYVREVQTEELEGPLDSYEAVTEGLFRRRIVNTKAGRQARVYVDAGEIPNAARNQIERWEGRRVDSRDPDQLRRFW